jgi:hypothetical protein
MPVYNWCYGAKTPTENLAIVEEQIRLAHQYRNKLVELELARRKAAESAARALHPEFDSAAAKYAEAQARVDAAYAVLKECRVKARKRVEPTAEQRESIEKAKAERRAAGLELGQHKKAAYKALTDAQKPYREIARAQLNLSDDIKPATAKKLITERYLELLRDADLSGGLYEFARDVKEARKASGLFWGTYLPVEDSTKDFQKGAPPKFRRFDGRGFVAIQLQRGLTFRNATECTDTRLQISLPETTYQMASKGKDRGARAIGSIKIRIGSDDREPVWATVPFTYHRPIPPDAVIKWAFLHCRRVGMHNEWSVRLTIETEYSKLRSTNGQTVAVHLGFRKVATGLRVATAVDTDGRLQELIIDDASAKSFGFSADLISTRDNIANAVLEEFRTWADSAESSDWFKTETETLSHWRHPDRLNRLVERWRDNRFAADSMPAEVMPATKAWAEKKLREYKQSPGYRPRIVDDLTTVFGLMEFWRKFDKHLVEWSANQTQKCVKRREQLYRTFVAGLRTSYQYAIVADVNWREMREKPEADEEETISTRGRRASSIAAPGRMSEILAESFGKSLVRVASNEITSTCNACNAHHEFDRTRIMTTCTKCGAVYDQDHNAVKNTLASGLVMLKKIIGNAGVIDTDSELETSPRKPRRNRKSA